jgi:hypothetical protein
MEAPLLCLVDRFEAEGNFIDADNLLRDVLQIPAF